MTVINADDAAGQDVTRRSRFVPHAGRVDGPREETSLLAFLTVLLNHRRLIILCALAGTAIFGARAASQASLYLSRASFVVKGSRAPAQVAGGAQALGISLAAAAEFSQSIVFYSDLVKAKAILVPVAAQSYETSDSKGVKRPLAEIMGIKASSPRAGAIAAANELIPYVSSTIYSRSGIVGIAVQSVDPLVAQQLAGSVLKELDQYSRTRRLAVAKEERRFIEGLVADAKVRLTQAEQALSAFLVENREYEGAPQLTMERNRLDRDVAMRQQIYTSLAQALEQAKVEEVRDPSALSVVETPDLPADPQRTTALRKTLLGFAAGMLVGIVLAFIIQRAQEKQQSQSAVWMRFAEALRG
jgi:uncharacterized protein involved in exopolysaccharide biosynthesis